MAPEGQWGGMDSGDALSIVGISGLFIGLYTTEVVLTVPSGAEIPWALSVYGISLPNITQPVPMTTASSAWKDYKNDLTQLRDELGQLILTAAGREGTWTGDSADSLQGYAEGKLINGMDALIDLADTVGDELGSIAESAWVDLVFNVALAGVLIAFQVAAQTTKAIPFVGMVVFAGITWASFIALTTATVIMIAQLIGGMMTFSATQDALSAGIRELEQTFGSEKDKLDSSATQIKNREIKSILD